MVVEPVLLEDILVPTDDEDSREVVQCGLDEIIQELHNHLVEIHVQRIKARCVLLQDSLRFASRHLAFCFKAHCVLLQSSLFFASRHDAFCFKKSCILSQDSCDLSHGGIVFCLLLKTLSGIWDVGLGGSLFKNFAKKESMKKAFQDMLHELGEVNLTHAYCNGSRISKVNEDPSWNKSFKTKSTQKTTSVWKRFGRLYLIVFVLVRNIVNSDQFMNVFMRIGFGSTIKLVSFDESQVVTFHGKFVCGFRNSDCGTRSQSDNTVSSPHGFIIYWIVISKNIKEVTEVIDVEI
nr:hypothetical protein [Tanacetum cinerariifolium]